MSDDTNAPKTVKAYLAQLKLALAGQKRAVIADALADAEDHLRAAIAQEEDRPVAEVLDEVVQNFGSPEEAAEEYKKMANASTSPFEDSPAPMRRPERRGFFSAFSDPRSYGALIYMLLSIVTGTFYFTWVVTGLSLSIGLFILIIGIPFALLFLYSVRALAHIEGRIVEALLDVRMPRRAPASPDASGGSIMKRIGRMLSDPRTWTAMFYMVLMLGLGIFYFTSTTVGITFALMLIGGPFWQIKTGNDLIRFGDRQIDAFFDTDFGVLLLIPVGFLLLIFMLNYVRMLGYLHGRIAEGLLVRL